MKIVTLGKKGTSSDLEAVILGRLGMYSAQYVAERTGLSTSQIYARWRAVGIKVRDIRNHGNEFNNRVADLARQESIATIADIKGMIQKMLGPVDNQHKHESSS